MDNSTGKPIFGVAGFPPSFFESPLKKKRENIFAWLKALGIDWIELQCTYGVKMKDEQATLYRALAQEHGIGLSIHAPYYVTLASAKPEVAERSKEHLRKALALARKLEVHRIVFHPSHFPGSGEADRREGLMKVIEGLLSLRDSFWDSGVFLYAETAGHKSQLGSVNEIIEIAKAVDFVKPCIDLAHVHAFEGGALQSAEDFMNLFSRLQDAFGAEEVLNMHMHMYPVSINAGGERAHKAFDDAAEDGEAYGPSPEHFIEAIVKMKLQPVVICEARDTQDKGAMLLKGLYNKEQSLQKMR